MAEAHPILCSKCKKPGTADKAECASCGGRVVRLCGSCGFKNSAAKKYCDACGENFALAKAAPPKPEAKAPPPAPKPEPRPEAKPAPKPEPKPEPAPKPAPKIDLSALKLPEAKADDASPLELRPRLDTPAPRPLPAQPKPEPAKPEPPKPEPPKPEAPKPEAKASKDEAMERFLPKTIISRIPKGDKKPVVRDDEPVPDMRPPEPRPEPKPAPEPEKPAAPDGPPAKKKDYLKMRLEGQEPTPPPVRLPEPEPKKEAKAEPAPEKAKPAEKPPLKPGELDPRLAKGFERREKEKPPAAPPPKKVEGPSQTFIQRRPKAVLSTVMALVLLATGVVAYLFKTKQKADPGDTLLKAAGDYLFLLKQKDFDQAYALLSADSKRNATAAAFKALQDEGFWSFDDLGGEIVAPGWAVVRYKLLVPNQPVESDWLVMRHEEGRWTRAYWWPLMDGIEKALAGGDHAAAARLAREAAAIDPLDPMPAAYYCEAAWLAGDAGAALESCQKALKGAESLPSRLGNDGLFRARHIIADVTRHTLKRTAEASELYGQLLKYPRLEPEQACDLNLAKAEADLELGRGDGALEAFRQAASACRPEADAAFAAQGVQVLSGAAGADAVAAVQAHRMPGDDASLAEWRAKSRAELARKLRTRPQDMPAEKWEAAHKAGALYVVTLRAGESPVLTAEVDLFSRKIKVDMNVQ